MYSMDSAPRDGSRILLKYWPLHYSRIKDPKKAYFYEGWARTPEPKWEECHWIGAEDERRLGGSNPHWEPWTGNPRTITTEHIRDENCIGWIPLPE